MDLITLIIPCYNEQESLPILYSELVRVSEEMREQSFEFLFVNDSSRDNTLEVLRKLADQDERVKYISFSRNFGKESAMYAGLENARGDYVAFMDADMQDPPSLLPEMYRAVTEEEYDSAATRRVTRKGEPPIRSFFARAFYKFMNKISEADIVDGARDFRLMNRKFVDALLQMKEYNRFSKGLFGWVGYKTKWIEFENVERVAGETKWSFWSLFKYSIEGILAFTTAPLVMASVLGVILCFLAFVFIVFIIVRKICFDNSVDGWASMVCIISLLGGLQLFAIGVVGQYLAKLYLEVKKRPIYLIGETNIEDSKVDSK